MKKYIFAFCFTVLLAAANPVFADGGMSYSGTMTISDQLSLLKRTVSLTSYLRYLQSGVVDTTYADEGIIVVDVGKSTRFACEDKVETDGDWCVRHVGNLGESYIDISVIDGFPYNEELSYVLRLMRVRDDEVGYKYSLIQIEDIKG